MDALFTFVVGEVLVVSGVAGVVAVDDVGAVRILVFEGFIRGVRGIYFVVVIGSSFVVVEERERGGGVAVERGRVGGVVVRGSGEVGFRFGFLVLFSVLFRVRFI